MRILIVDDHPLTCAGLRSLLASAYPAALVQSAHGAIEARAILEHDLHAAQPIDWLFLDIHLPDDPDWKLFKWLRHTAWIEKTILISAEMEGESLRAALGAGVRGFIPKSADPDMVLEGFDTICSGGIYLPPNMAALRHAEAGGAQRAKTLSPRQKEVLALLLQGASNKIIARELNLTLNTVKEYVSVLLEHYRVSTRLELVLKIGAKRVPGSGFGGA